MPAVAVPPVMPNITSTRCVLDALRLTVKFMFVEPLSPSATVGELTDTVSPSSSLIVPVPLPAVDDTVALVGLLRVTTTVSCDSWFVSPVTDTAIVWLVVPGANVSVPAVSAV